MRDSLQNGQYYSYANVESNFVLCLCIPLLVYQVSSILPLFECWYDEESVEKHENAISMLMRNSWLVGFRVVHTMKIVLENTRTLFQC